VPPFFSVHLSLTAGALLDDGFEAFPETGTSHIRQATEFEAPQLHAETDGERLQVDHISKQALCRSRTSTLSGRYPFWRAKAAYPPLGISSASACMTASSPAVIVALNPHDERSI
jgi:hypothetical protein